MCDKCYEYERIHTMWGPEKIKLFPVQFRDGFYDHSVHITHEYARNKKKLPFCYASCT
jgi:hypothetical protein